jgi:hypothetical protein
MGSKRDICARQVWKLQGICCACIHMGAACTPGACCFLLKKQICLSACLHGKQERRDKCFFPWEPGGNKFMASLFAWKHGGSTTSLCCLVITFILPNRISKASSSSPKLTAVSSDVWLLLKEFLGGAAAPSGSISFGSCWSGIN